MTSQVWFPRLERRARRIHLCIKILTRSSAIQVWAFISLLLHYYCSWLWYNWNACIPHFKLIWHFPWICYHGICMTSKLWGKVKSKMLQKGMNKTTVYPPWCANGVMNDVQLVMRECQWRFIIFRGSNMPPWFWGGAITFVCKWLERYNALYWLIGKWSLCLTIE